MNEHERSVVRRGCFHFPALFSSTKLRLEALPADRFCQLVNYHARHCWQLCTGGHSVRFGARIAVYVRASVNMPN